jgi:RNA polymerase sigma-70 factor (ECF subfamily)
MWVCHRSTIPRRDAAHLVPAATSDSELRQLLDRLAAGDLAARQQSLQAASARLNHLARQMLRDFATVRRWADTGDVVQDTLIRLHRVLEGWSPGSAEDFFQMAATQMRRSLLDLARYYGRTERAGLRAAGDAPADLPVEGDSSGELERWRAFHEAVERLPDHEREVVALRYYHGWPVQQVAESLRISERTVIRRWQAALWRLAGELGRAP